jgi:hypothetical protein
VATFSSDYIVKTYLFDYAGPLGKIKDLYNSLLDDISNEIRLKLEPPGPMLYAKT